MSTSPATNAGATTTQGSDMNSNNNDEWIFTLHVPNSISSNPIQLRQKHTSSSSLPRSHTNPLPGIPSSSSKEDETVVTDDYDTDRSERINLLNNNKTTIGATKASKVPPSVISTGAATAPAIPPGETRTSMLQQGIKESYMWTYQSPFWSISSTQLLSITYCPSWQAIPEYTTQLCNCLCGSGCSTRNSSKYHRSNSNSSNTNNRTTKSEISSISRLCCWNTCGSYTTPNVDYIQEIFTVSDIAKIVTSNSNHDSKSTSGSSGTNDASYETIPMTHIRGIGDCHTMKVYLRPMSTTNNNYNMRPPNPYLQEAWEKHVERMIGNGRSIKQTLRSSTHLNDISKTTTTTTNTHDETDTVHSMDDDQLYIGPIITFCIPVAAAGGNASAGACGDPPLLWKVFIPPIPNYPISIQTITILDGQLHTTPTPSTSASQVEQQQQKPTHVYINGYQSWSFSGSLIKGQKQPGSALPNTFSKAFNLGGSPPPVASTILQTDSAYPATNITSSKPFYSQYQSDFFTCITSDGRPVSNSTNILRPSSGSLRFPYQQLDETGGPALLLGWLSQNEQFGVINVDAQLSQYQMHCSVDGQMLVADNVTGPIVTDWAYAQLVHPHSYDEEPMAHYLHNVGRYSEVSPLLNGGLLTGWCSWYVYYQNINDRLLRDNVKKLAEMRHHVPTNVSVVDDGYMTAWGDWDSLKPKDFPNGMATVSNDISSRGMRPGLWLAPFGADKNSVVVQQHPEWVICNDSGIAANSSYCGKFFYGLDATNPSVREHVHESIRRAVHDWKYDVLKIDFLYAACLVGNSKYDLSISRAQAMRLALKTIRDAAGPDVFLIGCGCPIASGIGYVDAMRISADTGPTWNPPLPLPWWDNGTLPALRSMIRNSIARAPFGHRWWHNDPDCLMLGSHTSLSDDEVASTASVVAMTCGMLLLSDDLPTLSEERLSIVSKIFPLTGATAAVLDLHSTNDGLPSLMRLWCTDKYDLFDSISDEMDVENRDTFDHNAKATLFARKASFNFKDDEQSHPSERLRSCIHVTKGLGTWTLISLSNWSDQAAVVRIPPPALLPPPSTGWGIKTDADALWTPEQDDGVEHSGYHVFSFWSSKYSWLANHKEDLNDDPDHTVCKTLRPHQTELFHIKRVTPDKPQYLGTLARHAC